MLDIIFKTIYSKIGFGNAYFITYVLIAATLPLNKISLNSASIIALGAVWLIEPNWNQKWINLKKYMPFSGVMIGYFLLHVFSLSYTSNIQIGSFVIEKKLSFLFLPLIMFSSSYKPNLSWILFVFMTSLSILIVVDFFNVVLNSQIMSEYQLKNGYDYRLAIVEKANVSATYRSLHCVLAIVFGLYSWNQFTVKFAKPWVVACVLINTICILILASKITFISIVICSLFFILFYTNYYNNKIYLLILFSSIILASIVIWSIPSSKARFTELLSTPFVPATGNVHNSITLRAAHLHCNIELAKNHYLLGVGAGDVQDLMDNCYKSNHFSDFLYLDNKHNCHNQYFQTLLGLGIVGLAILLLIYLLPFVLLKNNLNFVILFVIGTFVFTSLTESVFEVQKGIVLFTFFYCLLIINQYKINPVIK
jgi:O-antigen ligase